MHTVLNLSYLLTSCPLVMYYHFLHSLFILLFFDHFVRCTISALNLKDHFLYICYSTLVMMHFGWAHRWSQTTIYLLPVCSAISLEVNLDSERCATLSPYCPLVLRVRVIQLVTNKQSSCF